MGKSTISEVIFNSYFDITRRYPLSLSFIIHYHYPLSLSTIIIHYVIHYVIHYYPLWLSTCSLSIFPPKMARFGPDVTERFLQETGYALVVRSHQACLQRWCLAACSAIIRYYYIWWYIYIYIYYRYISTYIEHIHSHIYIYTHTYEYIYIYIIYRFMVTFGTNVQMIHEYMKCISNTFNSTRDISLGLEASVSILVAERCLRTTMASMSTTTVPGTWMGWK